ncbi:IMP cyclohydrolase-like protein [Paenibacillus cellulosilyticus]|uniref:IMP cyclohydrolase-like protein n=1 Tax=Paenibacillus cellulosilyticus TaxID=375489 RepID=A0A2V2YUJ8_9BACL|nr:IMP cyclohydrolase [Paenibacillus cellulosilyticus]PWW04765.1 IMP cyclohydrolase-like protein [Paenibacillus cellulosilyticus]QKS45888.1 IMP cyclohydrolase [Paenibacillus cellulosilyticus]
MVEEQLFAKPYPGRTLIVGQTPSASHYVQVYWTMGRSVNSRNRVFEREGNHIKNTAFDPALMEDPSLIIYYPVRDWNGIHIVSNGDQTDTIYEGVQRGESFQQLLTTREFEPDPPHYTPRISAVIDCGNKSYTLSILKTNDNDPSVCQRQFFDYSGFEPGAGHCLHTYSAEFDGILKPFVGEPFEVPLFDDIEATADFYWERLNSDNKISLLVKFIDVSTQTIQFVIRNKHR